MSNGCVMPWEAAASGAIALPWSATISTGTTPLPSGDLLYPRLVAVHRLKTVAGSSDTSVGFTGYSGAEATTVMSDVAGETVLFTNIPATIVGRPGRSKGPLPGDVVYKPVWTISIPAASLALYDVRDRDILVDDEGYRYEVSDNYWTIAGYELGCVRLEA